MNRPKFITFTGFDDDTPVHGMHLLAAEYPVEWGVLFSPKQQGQGRYPSMPAVHHLLEKRGPLRLAAHLCGEHSRTLLRQWVLDPLLHRSILKFGRVQVNIHTQLLPVEDLGRWAHPHGFIPILQYRDGTAPRSLDVQWLFDASGGRGLEPPAWPEPLNDEHASKFFKGYAGGLNADNVAQHVEAIGAKDQAYWIDMESGVRDRDDRFSLALCRKVCEAVYPRRSRAA